MAQIMRCGLGEERQMKRERLESDAGGGDSGGKKGVQREVV
jgi:hypothetical protein